MQKQVEVNCARVLATFSAILQVWVFYTFYLVYILFSSFSHNSPNIIKLSCYLQFFFFLEKEIKMSAVNFATQSDDTKICVVMVGLPARGKSLIAGKGK